MIDIDITEKWEILRSNPELMHHYILGIYGADRTEMVNFPYTALYAGENTLGLVDSYTYPRVTIIDERIHLQLSDVLLSIDSGRREALRDRLAELAHEQWSGWMRYLFSKTAWRDNGTAVIPKWAVDRWKRQMDTTYPDLSDEEKTLDRLEADKVMALFDNIPDL